MNFIKRNWLYIIIAFSITALLGIGYITFTQLNKLTLTENITTSPTPSTQQPEDVAEISFQITPEQQSITSLTCIELVGTPLEGDAPLTVSFTGLAGDTSTQITFNFDFGDGETAQYPAKITSNENQITQTTSHTYIAEGTYTATLSVLNETNSTTSPSCSLTINVHSSSLSQDEINPTSSLAMGEVSPTLTPFPPTASPIPTNTPTKTPTPTFTPIPTLDKSSVDTFNQTEEAPAPEVPTAGSPAPFFFLAIGGILLVIIAFAIIKT